MVGSIISLAMISVGWFFAIIAGAAPWAGKRANEGGAYAIASIVLIVVGWLVAVLP